MTSAEKDDPLVKIAKKIADFKDKMSVAKKDTQGIELARLLVLIKEYLSKMQQLTIMVGALRDELAYTLIPDAFEREGITTYTLKEGYRVTISSLVRASTRDMEKGIKWMKESGYIEIVKETINASTLSALVKDLLEEGKELPDDIFNVHIGFNTSVTKVK